MSDDTVTRADLGDAVHRELGLSRGESARIVESLIREIGDALVGGEAVKLSSFGSFSVRHEGSRIGRNPKTRETIMIPPRRVLVFRASHSLKKRMNVPPAS